MKIIEMTRTVSGNKYDNISAKATLDDEDDFIKTAIELEAIIQKALKEINDRQIIVDEEKKKKNYTVPLLYEMPF